MKQGILIVVSAPSGAGKRTVLHRVFEEDDNLEYSVSATTREPRVGEVDGKDYVFLDRETFSKKVDAGDFVEWAEVHGNLYGTLHEDLASRLASGKDVVLELDVQGMRNVHGRFWPMVTVFIMAPSLDALESRLRHRGGLAEEELALRLRNAEAEIASRSEYDYVVVNDKVEEAAAELSRIIREHRKRAADESEEPRA